PSGSVTVGGAINDVAHLTGGFNPQGTITYNLYGPTDSTCSANPLFTTTKAASGDGDYTAANYTTADAATYPWRVSCTASDGNNNDVALTACADESVVVTKASPGLTTTPSGSVAVGGNINDVAHLTGGFSPTGTITYNLYGPTDATCSASAIFSTTTPVNGNNDYTSSNYTTAAAGTYHWRGSHRGDRNNKPPAPADPARQGRLLAPATPRQPDPPAPP